MTTTSTTRGDRLRAAREGFGAKNKSEFARQIGIRPETLWRFETNREQPSAEVLARAAQVTGRPFEELYGASPRVDSPPNPLPAA